MDDKILFPTKMATRRYQLITQDYYGGKDFYPAVFGTASHAAEDIFSKHGDELIACERLLAYKTFDGQGRDIQTGLSKGWGLNALSAPGPDGTRREWIYWHTMSNVVAKQGQWIEKGVTLAFEGDSGQVYQIINGTFVPVPDEAKGKAPFPGTHVHWGYRDVRPVDASAGQCLITQEGNFYLDENGKYLEIVDYDNGNKGFKDPMKLNIQFYDEWMLEIAAKAAAVIPEIPAAATPEQRSAIVGGVLAILTAILNFFKGRK